MDAVVAYFHFNLMVLWNSSFNIWCCSSADGIECFFQQNCSSIQLIFFRKHDLDSFWKTDGLVSSVMVCGLNRLLRFYATEYTMETVVQPCTLEWQSVVMQVEFSSWVHQIMAGHEFWDNVHYDDFLLWQICILCEVCHAASDECCNKNGLLIDPCIFFRKYDFHSFFKTDGLISTLIVLWMDLILWGFKQPGNYISATLVSDSIITFNFFSLGQMQVCLSSTLKCWNQYVHTR